MTKFSAQSALDLRTPEATAGRFARGARFIVQVEADDGSWFELDAETGSHAEVLAKTQVDKMKARGASCWCVSAESGALARQPFFTYYWTGK